MKLRGVCRWSWMPLGSPRAPPERSWRLLGASWPLLGASWGALGASWAGLGASWAPPGAVLGPLGASWAGLGAPWERNMAPRWPQKGPKRVPKSTKNRTKNRSENRSEIESDPGRPFFHWLDENKGFRGVGRLPHLTSGQPPKLSIRLKI